MVGLFIFKRRQTATQWGASGFTLIEIIVASALFGLFLIAAVFSYLSLDNISRHGNQLRRANNNASLLIDDVSRAAETAASATVTGETINDANGNKDMVIKAVSPTGYSNATCGPVLTFFDENGNTTYKFALKSLQKQVSGNATNAYIVTLNNSNFNDSAGTNTSNLTQEDGTAIDISQTFIPGINDGDIFCVYTDPSHNYVDYSSATPISYVEVAFVMNNFPNQANNLQENGGNGYYVDTTVAVGGGL